MGINSLIASELIERMMHERETPPSEGYRLACMERGAFAENLFLEIGYSEEFDLNLKTPDGEIKRVTIPAEKIDLPALSGPSRPGNQRFSLEVADVFRMNHGPCLAQHAPR